MSMTKEERKEYMKAYYQAHKEKMQAKHKAWYEDNRESEKVKCKAWREANKDKVKAWNEAHKKQRKEYKKAYQKTYRQAHKEYYNEYIRNYTKNDVNSLGQTKESIRHKSRCILKKSGINIPDYEIHHCFTYDDPSKFIYCSKEIHLQIHQFLRDNNIDADSDHYEQIKCLLNEKVITFGL